VETEERFVLNWDPDPFEWDAENSEETIDQEDDAVVYATGGSRNFTWSISGTGFWLNDAYTITELETDTRSVTILYR